VLKKGLRQWEREFIGNSFTFFNHLPEMFADLARSGGHEVEVDMSAQGRYCVPAGAGVCSSGRADGAVPHLFFYTLTIHC
jgi:hypothetical protein